jgi:hypothetical protein
MVGLLYDHYPERMFEDSTGCHYLLLTKNIRVYPKKLNDKYLPSNIILKALNKKEGKNYVG